MPLLTHQELGNRLRLFFIDESSPGSIFWLPHGTVIYNRLIDYIRYYYSLRDYQEVLGPNIFDKSLWETSGHWEKYRENMFVLHQDRFSEEFEQKQNNGTLLENGKDGEEVDSNEKDPNKKLFTLKCMNCPSHCVMFQKMNPSYRDLPLRLAEFGVLHRNEASGALNGLLRVRRFQQDDSHIFCTLDHIKDEIFEILNFIDHTYRLFGMEYRLYVSTRPEKYIGDLDTWNRAEEILKECVLTVISRNSKKKKKVKIKEGDGAFYGPKIDITIMDNHKREQQCGTIQLDFNLPSEERFNLQYTASDQSKQHPIIIHRAILGSLERFIGIMLEHTQGKLPFWLSPRQIGVTTVNKEYNQYAEDVVKRLRSDLPGVRVDFDKDVTDDLRNQIKHMTSMRYNVIVTIGQNEKDDGTITFRSGKSRITKTYDDFVSDIKSILTEYRL